jgi:hypothetical protein
MRQRCHKIVATIAGARALDFLEAVGLGLIAETVTMLAKAARREREPVRAGKY